MGNRQAREASDNDTLYQQHTQEYLSRQFFNFVVQQGGLDTESKRQEALAHAKQLVKNHHTKLSLAEHFHDIVKFTMLPEFIEYGDLYLTFEPLLAANDKYINENLSYIIVSTIEKFWGLNPKDSSIRILTQADLVFEVLQRNFSHECLSEIVSTPGLLDISTERGFTIVHYAVQCKLYRLVMDVFIDQLGFDPDFYRPGSRLTLLHVVAKYNSKLLWSECQKT